MTKNVALFLARVSALMSFAAAMVAVWSFLHQQPDWGALYMAISAVGVITFIATDAASLGL